MLIAIAHAEWAPGRKEGLARLLKQVPNALVVTSTVKEHASVWAPRLWRAAYEKSEPDGSIEDACLEWCVFLNDDVEIAPPEVIELMLQAVPDEVWGVSLATVQKEARKLYGEGHRYLASYLATGPAYAIRRETLPELADFYDKLPEGMRKKMNEDEVLSHFAWSKQQPFFHCLPALVEHDTKIPSTLGYDNHPMRIAEILWDEVPSGELLKWHVSESIPYVNHAWMGEGRMRAVRAALNGGVAGDVNICVFCAERQVLITSPKTGAGLCGQCAADAVGHVLTNARVA